MYSATNSLYRIISGTVDKFSDWLLSEMNKRDWLQADLHRRSGMDILSISKLLGHSNLSVVQRYLAQTGEDLRLAHIRAGPVDNM